MAPLSMQLAAEPEFESWMMPLAMLVYATAWFVFQWGDYDCGIFDIAGVTEAEFTQMVAFVAPTVGPDIFDMSLPWTEVHVRTTLGLIFVMVFPINYNPQTFALIDKRSCLVYWILNTYNKSSKNSLYN